MSSKTCSVCNKKGEREKEEFACHNSNCSEYLVKRDSDTNAAKVLKGRGRAVVEKHFSAAIMGTKGHLCTI